MYKHARPYQQSKQRRTELNFRQPIWALGIFVLNLMIHLFLWSGLLSFLRAGIKPWFPGPPCDLCKSSYPSGPFFLVFVPPFPLCCPHSSPSPHWMLMYQVCVWLQIIENPRNSDGPNRNPGVGSQGRLRNIIEGPHSLVFFHRPLSFGLLPHGHKMVTELPGVMSAF